MAANDNRQRGFALITVLLILAIMITIATTMSGRLALSLRRTEGMIASQSVYWYGQSAAELGRMVLNEDFADSDVSSLDQLWATPDLEFPLDNGYIGGEMKDLRSCFNVNAVGSTDDVNQFTTLLEILGLSNDAAEMIAESTRDWIDENDSSEGSQGAEDGFYEGRSVAHLAANNLMVNISELRAVQGVDWAIYEKIEPYLCAIPSSEQKINVNTVSVEQPEILYALFDDADDLSLAGFTTLLEGRPTSGWDDVDDFLDSSFFTGVGISTSLKAQLSVTSEYFQFNSVASFNERLLAFKFLFYIEENTANVIRYQSGGVK